MPYFSTLDNCCLYYEVIGDGSGSGKPVITFINGTLQTTVYWKQICKILSDRFRLLIYDCRGQGESELGDIPLTLDLHAEDLKTLLGELNIHKTNIVGISHGARVALSLANDFPELVGRMLLCSIATRSNFRAKMIVRSWFEILQRHSLDAMVWAAVPYVFGQNFIKSNFKVLDRIVKTIVRRNRTDALRTHLEAMQRYPLLSKTIKKLPFEILLLTGEDDPLVNLEGAQEIVRICGGKHQELAGIGHSLPAESPGIFSHLADTFFRGINRDSNL